MLAGVIYSSSTYILCGLILSLAFGLAVGNYACSLVHRLPRGKLLLDKTPYCGTCGALLKVPDLFPVVSALMLKHRCRYCNAPFPTSHTWTEVIIGALFMLAFLRFNFSQEYILIVTLGTFLTTLAAIEANERMLMVKILLCIAIFGMLYRTLADHSIYGFFIGGFSGLIIGAVLQYKKIKRVGHIYVPPLLGQLLAVGGICVGFAKLPLLLLVFSGFYLLSRIWEKIPITVPFGLAVMLVVMYG